VKIVLTNALDVVIPVKTVGTVATIVATLVQTAVVHLKQ